MVLKIIVYNQLQVSETLVEDSDGLELLLQNLKSSPTFSLILKKYNRSVVDEHSQTFIGRSKQVLEHLNANNNLSTPSIQVYSLYVVEIFVPSELMELNSDFKVLQVRPAFNTSNQSNIISRIPGTKSNQLSVDYLGKKFSKPTSPSQRNDLDEQPKLVPTQNASPVGGQRCKTEATTTAQETLPPKNTQKLQTWSERPKKKFKILEQKQIKPNRD